MGISNYIGKRAKPKKGSNENITVADYMSTKLKTFRPEQNIMEVMETLVKFKISGGPVVNDQNVLVGIISEGDCLKQISESRYHNMRIDDATVEKHMVRDVETIDGNMNIFDAANQFLQAKRRRFPIVREGKLVGLISQKDILKAALNLKQSSWK